MIIGITGQCIDSLGRKRIAGAGKDVVAKRLIDNYAFVSLASSRRIRRSGTSTLTKQSIASSSKSGPSFKITKHPLMSFDLYTAINSRRV